MAQIPVCPDSASVGRSLSGSPTCSEAWEWLTESEVFSRALAQDLELHGPTLAEMFAGGFVLVGSVWLIGWCAAAVVNTLR